jgi:hypothetical protein
MGKLARSWRLMKQSYRVLMQDKELLLLPVLSGLCIIVVIGSFVIPVVARGDFDPDQVSDKTWVLATLLFYVVTYTIAIFFQAAIIAGASERMRGGDPTLGSALGAAGKRFGAIVVWGIVAGTVGMILRAIQERSELIGRIVVALVGAAWSLATFFVIPVIVMERESVGGSFKRSIEMIRKTWGESVAGNVGLGLAGFLFLLPFIGIAGLLASQGLAIAAGAVFGLGILLQAVLFSAMQAVYVAALYRYASSGQEPGGFNIAELEEAFR